MSYFLAWRAGVGRPYNWLGRGGGGLVGDQRAQGGGGRKGGRAVVPPR